MLENVDGWHLLVVVLAGLFILGPDKLPAAISDGVRLLRQLRRMVADSTGQLSRELGTDLSLDDLHPKTLLRKHLLSEEEEAALRAPLRRLADDLHTTADALDPPRPPTASATPTAARPAIADDLKTIYRGAT